MVNLFLRVVIVLFGLISLQQAAQAAPLDLVLTQGVSSALPIAIVPFSGQQDLRDDENLSNVITADLQNSGQFKPLSTQAMTQTPNDPANVDNNYWRSTGVDNVVVGQVKSVGGGKYQVSFALLDVFKGQANAGKSILLSKDFTVPKGELRAYAHHISDMIYEKLTGVRGVFSTKIAYVLVQRSSGAPAQYTLEIADADGYNPRAMLSSKQPIMSPAWSRDGTRISYVSFEKVTPQIFVQDVATASRRVISSFPGINGAPAWSPQDDRLALVLSKGGESPKIYVMNVSGGQLQQVTFGNSIDTEPNWSPDGQSLIFTSDRGGGPQIYQVNLKSGDTQRLTFHGSYNARASFSSDGKNIVMINRDRGMYNIALQNLQSGTVLLLTNSGYDASPSIAPNGRMVLYETDQQQGVLGMASTDGKVKLRLPAPNGSVQDPAWSPYLG